MSTPKPRPRRSKPDQSNSIPAPLLRLIAAALLFVLCFAAKVQFPRQSQHWRSQLTRLMGAHTDWEGTFSRLGEELERREQVVHAVGDWCVSVFGPENVKMSPGEASDGAQNEADTSALPAEFSTVAEQEPTGASTPEPFP